MCFFFHSRIWARIKQLEVQQALLTERVDMLNARIEQLETEVRSGIVANPPLQQFLESKMGQNISISTSSVTVLGTVLAVGKDAVEIRETSGDIVIIPFSQISVAQ
ncbi:hypothetical protein ACFSVM_06300 [Paenibacillus shunpengii]|uniref:DUF2642 domain-containing protein n=1 Tax=Paenibacillus shunpengii TaxID=2054424 RepID=A0ABW5SMR6_9BACL|nr:hypothetical protein [Paenibacillus sp. FSL H7-0326]OMC71055.1 hypothetical protein BK126_02780 [Paenibacillus sp. FSL H7-0326]